jgi:hypothetical protein
MRRNIISKFLKKHFGRWRETQQNYSKTLEWIHTKKKINQYLKN